MQIMILNNMITYNDTNIRYNHTADFLFFGGINERFIRVSPYGFAHVSHWIFKKKHLFVVKLVCSEFFYCCEVNVCFYPLKIWLF